MAQSTDIAFRYATAWLDAAEERGATSRIREEIDGFEALLKASVEFAAFFHDRSIPPEVKQDILTNIFQGKIDDITLNFLLLLVSKQREPLFADILAACHTLLDERDGIVNADVESAVALTEMQQASLQAKLEAMTGKRIRMHTHVDPGLISGFVVQITDMVFDGSLAAQLQRVRQKLVG